MKNILIIALITTVFPTNIFAQSIGEWKIYSDMKKINALTITTDGLWAATSGGAFKYNFNEKTFFTLTKANKFNSQALTSATIDNNGKIWFGTFEGYVIAYNPTNYYVKNIIDIYKSDKPQKQINHLFAKNDTIFASTDFGLALINSKNFSLYDTFIKLGNFPAESRVIAALKTSLIYACTNYGVAVQKAGATNLSAPESWNTYLLGADINATFINKIVFWNNKILIATDNGIFSLENNRWDIFLLPGSNVLDIFSDKDKLLIITLNEIYSFENNSIKKIFEDFTRSFNSITAKENKIYVGSNKGIIELSSGLVNELYPEGPAGNLFINLSVDGSGNLWVATGKDGAGIGFMKFDGNKWTLYNKETYPQLPSNDYYNVYAGADNTIYLANWGKGITIFRNNNFEVYKKDNSPLVGISKDTNFIAIPDIKVDSKGNVWLLNLLAANKKYINVLTKDKKWYSYLFTNPALTESDEVIKFVIDQYDTKWFFLFQGRRGLYYFNENGTFENLSDDKQGYISSNNGLITDEITALAVDKRGQLWIGTTKGMNYIPDPSNPRVSDITIPALRNQSITCIAIDALDQKWVGTNNGIVVLSPDGLQLLSNYNSQNSPLPSNDIRSIAVDELNGRIYIGTDYGLAMIQTNAAKPLENFQEIFIYPNPFIIDGSNNNVTIDGLIANTAIKIIDVNGNLIKNIKTPGGRIATWDGKDNNGNYVQSGIYLIIAYDEEANNVASGKIAIIRK